MAKSRRFLGIILSLAMILLLLPVQGMAAETVDPDATTAVAKTEAELVSALANGGSVKLEADIALAKPLTITKATVLDLGGHTVTLPMYTEENAYGVVVNAPDAAVTITNGKWVCGEGNDQLTFMDHKEGVLTLSDLEVQASMGVYSEARVDTVENCKMTCKGFTMEDMTIGGWTFNLDFGGEIGTIKNCTLVGTVATFGLELYEGGLTDDFKAQFPEAYAETAEKVQAAKDTGRDTGHIDAIEDTSMESAINWQPCLHLQTGGLVDLVKNVTFTTKGLDMIAIWVMDSAEIGEIADCTVDVSGGPSGIAIQATGGKIGTISGLKAKIQSTQEAGVLIFEENAAVGTIQNCDLTMDSPLGRAISITKGSAVDTIQDVTVDVVQMSVDEEGNKAVETGIGVENKCKVGTIADVTLKQGDLYLADGSIERMSNVETYAFSTMPEYYAWDPVAETDTACEAHNEIGTMARCTAAEFLRFESVQVGAIVDSTISKDVNIADSTVGLFARNTVGGPAHFLTDPPKEVLDNTFQDEVRIEGKTDKVAYNTFAKAIQIDEGTVIGVMGPNTIGKDTVVDNSGTISVIADEGTLADGTFTATAGWSLRGDGKVEKAETPETVSYTDVAEGIWYAPGVDYVTTRSLMDAEEKFEPDGVASRDTIMAILARMEGETISKAGEGMDWAKSVGISDGTNPDNPLTREQLAMVLYNLAGQPEVSEADKSAVAAFADAGDVSSWAVNGVAWALANEVINGTGTGLAPKLYMTRGMLAQLIYNLYG